MPSKFTGKDDRNGQKIKKNTQVLQTVRFGEEKITD